MKKDITDFTEDEFIAFMHKILAENVAPTDDVLDVLLEEFCEITGHPDGTDLIYYPEADSSGSAEDVTRVVKKWRAAQGLPGFKE
ncbi:MULTISPECIES: bacteriocin immunity protein [Pseudomonas]|uniref:bacteriocin immunity protein n=1 Tax=Pseudomonas TaxID=286 RepID=UPI000641DE4C|nr:MULTISPECIES: bacteriocin immunity protein [Pseudomonas]MBM1188527.1 bacteriocin immunity protein [Pseudomonas lundensis]NLU02588.1 bacteriocin immunity protein [Pseudomonas lundensis]NMY38699.1 bacteriocin immunity protein [Pseudomonas sp. WS 5078]NMY61722.1 bacteriocin immunity protein [Pseudomonas sp. WS 5354]NMY76162.1 bacteriocin immunity protein [Pseudomonas sp. WS 5071]